jgi:hypothetical protein
MGRYIVERTFLGGLHIPVTDEGVAACLRVVSLSAEIGVTWLHSYVTEDRLRTYCVYDGPDLDAIHRAAVRSGLPIDRVTRVRVLDPYFYG